MARIRTIKPELIEDSRTATLSDREWRLFVSLLLMADDYGNFRATAELIEAQVFWGSRSRQTCEELLAELENVGLISFYEVRGQRYGHVAGWAKHQRVDHPGKPLCPKQDEPDAWSRDDSVTYFVQQGEDGPIKIGRAVDVASRVARLQTSTPHALRLLGTLPGGDNERKLHERFKHLRMSGEWFKASPDLLSFVADIGSQRESSRDSREDSRESVEHTVATVEREVSRLTGIGSGPGLDLIGGDHARTRVEAPPPAEPEAPRQDRKVTGLDIRTWFATAREKAYPESSLPGAYAPFDSNGKADRFAASLPLEAVPDVRPAMELLFQRIKDQCKGYTDEKFGRSTFVFGVFVSEFQSLREEIHGVAPKVAPPQPAAGVFAYAQIPLRPEVPLTITAEDRAELATLAVFGGRKAASP